jgi:hypothetical protein
MFFANDKRDKVREDNPGIKFGEYLCLSCAPLLPTAQADDTVAGEVGKLLGEKWKELTDKDKKPYEDKAKVDKERYEAEKRTYQGASPA